MKYSQEIVKEICDWIEKGALNKEAAELSGISEETFYQWQREKKPNGEPNPDYHPEFSESVKKAVGKRKVTLINRVLTASKRSWQAAAWYLERRYPDEFGQRQKLEITDPEKELGRIRDMIYQESKTKQAPEPPNLAADAQPGDDPQTPPAGQGPVQE